MKMTEKRLVAMAVAGIGQRHRNEYKPFLDITRKNTSKVSNQSGGLALYGYARKFAYFSRGEREVAQFLMWLGASDVREQMPLWPMPHPHLLTGAQGVNNADLPDHPGLFHIAKEAGIDHGEFVGSKIPYVATIDMAVTVPFSTGAKLVAVSYKPFDKIYEAAPSDAILRRLELERRYCEHTDILRTVADRALFGLLIDNLAWLMPNSLGLYQYKNDVSFWRFRDILTEHMYRIPIRSAIQNAARHVGWHLDEANRVFKILVWFQYIDLDVRQPIIMSHPAKSGGLLVRQEFQKVMFGGIVDVDIENQ